MLGHIPYTAIVTGETNQAGFKWAKRERIDNVFYQVKNKDKDNKQILDFIEKHKNETGIIYRTTRKSVEALYQFLNQKGIKALPYHAGLTQSERIKNQEMFKKDQVNIIVATIAFGMGIDKANVRFVAHMDLPKCLESYYQETGRAGRDGLPAQAWMLYGLADLVLLKYLMGRGKISAARKRVGEEKLDAMLGICETTICRRQVLLNYFNDPYKGPCENCDTCLAPIAEKINATELAIKALKCVYQTEQKYGIHYMVTILTGMANGVVRSKNHHLLESFNVGKDESDGCWYSIYRQLIALGVLKMEMDGTSKIELTSKALPILEGKQEVWLRHDFKKSTPKVVPTSTKKRVVRKKVRKKRVAASFEGYKTFDNSDQTLLDNLKTFRKNLAKKRRTKAYKIFPDRTLFEMVESKPSELRDLEELYGVGPKKLKRFGKMFLEALNDFSNPY
jgi:ATP-dependent DNA helicase RecQ